MLESAETGRSLSKAEYDAVVPDLRVDLVNAQYDLKDAAFGVLVYLVGVDRLGIADTANTLNEWMDARYLATHVFHDPSEEERERPWAWRLWRAIPGKGQIALFFGSGAPPTIRARVLDRIDDAEVALRAQNHRRMLDALAADGMLVLKIWIHLSKEDARKRLKKARHDPDLRWRVDERDWAVLERYDEARPVVERYLRLTDDPLAPWHLVEGADARWRNVAVATLVRDALRARLDAPPAAPSGPGEVLPAVGRGHGRLDRVDLDARLEYEVYRERLRKLQEKLHGQSLRALDRKVSTILVFEGWDAAGKGGAIRRVTRALEAGEYRVVPIAAPTPEELAHHYLWRFWRELPRAGRFLIFDRSWYGRVLVERVEQLTPVPVWRRAYEEINDFERQLDEHGIVLAKFWLHLDPDEQLRRFRAREQTPYKKYKITDEDYRNRERWEDYRVAAEEMFARTSTDVAPWTLVAANDKRWARIQILETVTERLGRALRRR